jgi:AraC-like DNA-binding protein
MFPNGRAPANADEACSRYARPREHLVEQIARAVGYRSCSSFLRAFRQVHGYVPAKSEGDGPFRLKIWRGGHGSRSRQGRCDAIVSELRSMINGYRIDGHRAFPFTRRRRHPPTNSQYAFQAAVLWHTGSGGSADARVGGITWREQLRMYATDRGGPY